MKIIHLILFVAVILAPYPVMAANVTKPDKCPNGTEQALVNAGLEPTMEIYCYAPRIRQPQEKDFKVTQVHYQMAKGDLITSIFVMALIHKNSEIFLFPPNFERMIPVLVKLTEFTETPFTGSISDWSNFSLEEFSTLHIVKNEKNYCLEYRFKFPFSGYLRKCPNMNAFLEKIEPYELQIEVEYQEGQLTWKEALEIAKKACSEEFGRNCKSMSEEPAGMKPLSYWSGPHASTGIVYTDKPASQIKAYLFSDRLYNSGYFFTRVNADKTVETQVLDRGNYRFKNLVDISEGSKTKE